MLRAFSWSALFLALALAATPLAGAYPHGGSAPGTSRGVFLTIEEALELAFPDCEIERQVVYLTRAQRAEAERRLGAALESGVARPYVARKKAGSPEAGRLVGVAWVDTHRVRSLRETLCFAVTPDGRIGRIEVLQFHEPQEYMPRERWYAQFLGRTLDDDLALNRGIRPIAGATLSARATVDAARRSLALQSVLFPPPPVANTAP